MSGFDSPNPLSGQGGSVSTGSLRTKISLRAGVSVPASISPFHTMKPQLPSQSSLLGSTDLLKEFDLLSTYNKFCTPHGAKKLARENLNTYLPHLCGNLNLEHGQEKDISWLKMLVDKPPITGKEIIPLNASAMNAFKLQPGPVDEKYRKLFENTWTPSESTGDEKKKHRKYKRSLEPLEDELHKGGGDGMSMNTPPASIEEPERKKHKEEKEKKAKKKKKEKKNKKEKEDKL